MIAPLIRIIGDHRFPELSTTAFRDKNSQVAMKRFSASGKRSNSTRAASTVQRDEDPPPDGSREAT